jgi:hypothetical protein
MKVTLNSAASWLLMAGTLLAIPAAGSAFQCKRPVLDPGGVVETPGSHSSSCYCGILIISDELTCPTEVVYTPPHFTCDGAQNDQVDCALSLSLFVELRTQRCVKILGSITVTLFDSTTTITVPVCLGTRCEVEESKPISTIFSGVETPCNGGR